MFNNRIIIAAPMLVASTIYSSLAVGETAVDENAELNALAAETLVITATPFDDAPGQAIQPASVLTGAELDAERQNSLGEALSQQPGISNASFGPAVGQPVIRGLGAGRVTTLQNGLNSFDAASVSADHAVSSDLGSAERIEVLRGPATLLYGSGAIGGVVNTVDGLVSDEYVEGVEAELFGGLDSASQGRYGHASVAGGTTTGKGNLNVRLQVTRRHAENIDIPGEAEAYEDEHHDEDEDHDEEHEDEHEEESHGTLESSHREATNYAAAVNWVGDRGSIGVSFENLESLYGIPGHHHHEEEGEEEEEEHGHEEEEGVALDLEQQRIQLGAELFSPLPGFSNLKVQLQDSDYEHVEQEGDEAGTRFTVEARSGRVELKHLPIGKFEGVLGMQYQQREFAAIGEESFVPPVDTDTVAVFLVEKLALDKVTLEAGARMEQVDHQAQANPDTDFSLLSLSLGAKLPLSETLTLTGSISHNERAPTAEELYSNGAHLATNSFEQGDTNLDKERSLNFDLGLRFAGDRLEGGINVFYNQFSDFIYQASQDCNGDTEADRVDEEFDGDCANVLTGEEAEEALLALNYTADDADHYGAEAELIAGVVRKDNWEVDLRLWGDMVIAELDNGDTLPRTPPTRLGASLINRWGPFTQGASLLHAMEPDELAPLETNTDSYNKLDLWLGFDNSVNGGKFSAQLRLNNALDDEIRHHASFLKDQAPEAGRSVVLNVGYSFE